ncbi:DUF2243 domain-containing protein [Paenibacillus aestuarii]|uniref:DUF2243 domain-containing protein n=1 Tax=Paenibacillus aestuarii TaxID=516965 RepID=A0ABW0KEC2_9BACL|nr:DUF2243 domain-containing protein [Paenibacillus aestuarii]
MKRLLGVIAGAIVTYQEQHILKAYAFGYSNADPLNRIGAVLFGVILLVIIMELVRRICSSAFFNGFIVATGLFLSFDIVVFHWIFKLHRITSGSEANFLEPIFVLFGIFLLWQGIRREMGNKVKPNQDIRL